MQTFLPYSLSREVSTRATKHIYFLRNNGLKEIVKINPKRGIGDVFTPLLTKAWGQTDSTFEVCYQEDTGLMRYLNGNYTMGDVFAFKNKIYRLNLKTIDVKAKFNIVECRTGTSICEFTLAPRAAKDYSVQAAGDFIWIFHHRQFFLIENWGQPEFFDGGEYKVVNFRVNEVGVIYTYYGEADVDDKHCPLRMYYKVFSALDRQFNRVVGFEYKSSDLIIPAGNEFYIIRHNASFVRVSLDGKWVDLGKTPLETLELQPVPGCAGATLMWTHITTGISINEGLWGTGEYGSYIYNQSLGSSGTWKKVSKGIECLEVVPYYG